MFVYHIFHYFSLYIVVKVLNIYIFLILDSLSYALSTNSIGIGIASAPLLGQTIRRSVARPFSKR